MASRPSATDIPREGLVFLVVAATSYGALWPVTRVAVQFLSPYWYAFARLAMGCAILFAVQAATGRLRLPPRGDWPIVLSTGVVMIATYSCLFQLALQYIEAGRAALLGYTMPVWALLMSAVFLGDRPSLRRLLGLAVAIAGLAVLFNPLDFPWDDPDAMLGNFYCLLAAIAWAPVVLHLRVHRSTASTFQLVPWQLLVGGTVVGVIGAAVEGPPSFEVSWRAAAVLGYGGVIGTAVAMYAVTSTFRLLPTVTSTVGMLACPVLALVLSVIFLDERLTAALAVGLCLILGGIAMVSVPERRMQTGRRE